MLSYLQSAMIVLICVAVVLFITHHLNRRLEEDSRKRANGVNGWQLSILGAIYSVALGFMLSDAWLAYQTASVDVREEAAAVSSIYREAALLPAPCAEPLQNAALGYVQAVVNVEWPSMDGRKQDWRGAPLLQQMWRLANTCGTHQVDGYDRDQIIRALETLQARRDSRIEDYNGHLPLMMWVVLLFGAVIVIAASCLLGNEKQSIHCFHVISLTVLITVTLLAISDLDRPFDGATRIDPGAFRLVMDNMNHQPAA
jgi:Protein of unknown function (DUF4239)